jgi:hypothetical protein
MLPSPLRLPLPQGPQLAGVRWWIPVMVRASAWSDRNKAREATTRLQARTTDSAIATCCAWTARRTTRSA